MSTLQSMGLSLKDLILIVFNSGVDARHNLEAQTEPGTIDFTEYYDTKFNELLMMLGLDELKVN